MRDGVKEGHLDNARKLIERAMREALESHGRTDDTRDRCIDNAIEKLREAFEQLEEVRIIDEKSKAPTLLDSCQRERDWNAGRNVHVPEPLRSIVNAASSEVSS